MPKRKPTPRAPAYDSDDGFVAPDDGDADDAPVSKKVKKSATSARVAAPGKGKSGEEFWELTSKRRVGLSEFKGNVMVNIREYYEKDGEVLPGKKGISLPVEQFNSLIKFLPEIEAALAAKGQSVSRPEYGGGARAEGVVDGDDEVEEVEKKQKKNFEETSEDE